MRPSLTCVSNEGLSWHEDVRLREFEGIAVAFSTRLGGVSGSPFDSLDLAGHVGDDPAHVDRNRSLLLAALGIGDLASSLVTAEQVHGDDTAWVDHEAAGAGARVSGGREPIAATDALLTSTPRLPLMLLFADCVPVVLVDPVAPRVGVVHAGWRGALAGLPGKAVTQLVSAGSRPEDLLAYLGPHICARHYEVSNKLVTSFAQRFDTVCTAEAGHLDLGAVVSEDLLSSGVHVENICRLGVCTAEATDRFFSYRASSGITGRHAALAVILG